MFTLRSAVIIFTIALFLPATADDKQRVYSGVSAAVENVQTFCVRYDTLCSNVEAFANAVAQRVYYSTQMIYETTVGAPSQSGDWNRERPYPSQSERRQRRDSRYSSGQDRSSNTLERDDLDPDWRGPGTS